MTTARMIFSLNTGRCGSAYLQQMMDTVPGVCSLHEPPPAFHENWRLSYKDRKKWLKDVKIPYILGLSHLIYMETSAQFIRGFVEPMLDLGYIPDVIVIRRNLSEVALSVWRSNNTPGRTEIGKLYSYAPDDLNVFLKYPNYKKWTDYMVCYWGVLEMEYRMNKYGQMIKDAGGIVVETRTEVMTTKEGFMNILEQLNLPQPEMRIYDKIWWVNYNGTSIHSMNKLPAGDTATQESMIRDLFKDKLEV